MVGLQEGSHLSNGECKLIYSRAKATVSKTKGEERSPKGRHLSWPCQLMRRRCQSSCVTGHCRNAFLRSVLLGQSNGVVYHCVTKSSRLRIDVVVDAKAFRGREVVLRHVPSCLGTPGAVEWLEWWVNERACHASC